jgi:hypothetical protein
MTKFSEKVSEMTEKLKSEYLPRWDFRVFFSENEKKRREIGLDSNEAKKSEG